MVALHVLAVKELLPDVKKRLHAPPFKDMGLRGLPLAPTSSRNPLPRFAGLANSPCHSCWYAIYLAARTKSNDTLQPGHRGILAALAASCASW